MTANSLMPRLIINEPQKKRRVKMWQGKYCKDIMASNVPNLVKHINLKIQVKNIKQINSKNKNSRVSTNTKQDKFKENHAKPCE